MVDEIVESGSEEFLGLKEEGPLSLPQEIKSGWWSLARRGVRRVVCRWL